MHGNDWWASHVSRVKRKYLGVGHMHPERQNKIKAEYSGFLGELHLQTFTALNQLGTIHLCILLSDHYFLPRSNGDILGC